jgi:hypothetical protein
MKEETKAVYNILSDSDIIRYLNIKDKIELSSTCKYINKKLAQFRLQKLWFNSRDFQKYIDNTQRGIYWTNESYELKLDYFETNFVDYKRHLLKLTYGGIDYFLLEYFSLNFINLTSLWLDYIILPKKVLIKVIENASNLVHLTLWGIEVAYSKIDNITSGVKFSKYLTELKWENCNQFELDSTDLVSFKEHALAPRFSNSDILDISLNIVDTLKSLYWCHLNPKSTDLFNETILNNPGLTHLTISLYNLSLINLNQLANSPVLTKLTIYDSGEAITSDSNRLINFPNIKTLEFPYFFEEVVPSVNLLIENCPNLEKLKMFSIDSCDDYFFNYIKNFKHLKVLTIIAVKHFPSFLYNSTPQSNLEHLEIYTQKPNTIYFNNFINMPKLKLIKNSCSDYNLENWKGTPNYEDFKGWRMIKYPGSISYWKV